MATIKPLHDRVVVERFEPEEKTASGILLAPTAQEKPDMGIVLAVGAGKVLENGSRAPMCVAVGDKVLFGKYSGQIVKHEGKEVMVMREDDILAVIA
jgi:chaperonin GroES